MLGSETRQPFHGTIVGALGLLACLREVRAQRLLEVVGDLGAAQAELRPDVAPEATQVRDKPLCRENGLDQLVDGMARGDRWEETLIGPLLALAVGALPTSLAAVEPALAMPLRRQRRATHDA